MQAGLVGVDHSGGDAEWERKATGRKIDQMARAKPGHDLATLEHVYRPRYAFSPCWALVRIHLPRDVAGGEVPVAFEPGRDAGNWEEDSQSRLTHNAAALKGHCAIDEALVDAVLIGEVGWREAKSGAHHSGLRGEKVAQREPCWKSKVVAQTEGTRVDLRSS